MSDHDDTHGLQIVPPHALPNQLRTCVAGMLTEEEAQAHLDRGARAVGVYRVLEIRPAQCVRNERVVDATEIIFARAKV